MIQVWFFLVLIFFYKFNDLFISLWILSVFHFDTIREYILFSPGLLRKVKFMDFLFFVVGINLVFKHSRSVFMRFFSIMELPKGIPVFCIIILSLCAGIIYPWLNLSPNLESLSNWFLGISLSLLPFFFTWLFSYFIRREEFQFFATFLSMGMIIAISLCMEFVLKALSPL